MVTVEPLRYCTSRQHMISIRSFLPSINITSETGATQGKRGMRRQRDPTLRGRNGKSSEPPAGSLPAACRQAGSISSLPGMEGTGMSRGCGCPRCVSPGTQEGAPLPWVLGTVSTGSEAIWGSSSPSPRSPLWTRHAGTASPLHGVWQHPKMQLPDCPPLGSQPPSSGPPWLVLAPSHVALILTPAPAPPETAPCPVTPA